MWQDEIVEEARRAREEYAARFNYDLEAIHKDLKEQEEQGKRKVVSLPPKDPELIPAGRHPEPARERLLGLNQSLSSDLAIAVAIV